MHTACPAILIIFYFITLTISSEKYTSLITSSCSVFRPLVTSLLSSNILLTTKNLKHLESTSYLQNPRLPPSQKYEGVQMKPVCGAADEYGESQVIT
jgi:hypothetical protein